MRSHVNHVNLLSGSVNTLYYILSSIEIRDGMKIGDPFSINPSLAPCERGSWLNRQENPTWW